MEVLLFIYLFVPHHCNLHGKEIAVYLALFIYKFNFLMLVWQWEVWGWIQMKVHVYVT